MNPEELMPGQKYFYTRIVPGKHYCNLEQKPVNEVLTYSHESPYVPGYHLFHDQRGSDFKICLYNYVIREQLTPIKPSIKTTQGSMNIQQIKVILNSCEKLLETVNCSPEYQEMQDSEEWDTPNDLFLADAIQALYEVQGAVERIGELERKTELKKTVEKYLLSQDFNVIQATRDFPLDKYTDTNNQHIICIEKLGCSVLYGGEFGIQNEAANLDEIKEYIATNEGAEVA